MEARLPIGGKFITSGTWLVVLFDDSATSGHRHNADNTDTVYVLALYLRAKLLMLLVWASMRGWRVEGAGGYASKFHIFTLFR